MRGSRRGAIVTVLSLALPGADSFLLRSQVKPPRQILFQQRRHSTSKLDAQDPKNNVLSPDLATTNKPLTLEALRRLDQCSTSSQARSLLESNLLAQDVAGSNRLYESVQIPPGAALRGISDGDLAIQTRLTNKKYKIMDLIELSGDRDANRASLGVLCLTVASSMSALVAQQNLPGPEIVRFLVVWVLCFSPFFFIGYGMSTPRGLQDILVSIQRRVFPAYRRRMIQHEAGHLLMGHLLGWPVAGYQANTAMNNAVEFFPLADNERGATLAQQLGFDRAPQRPGDAAFPVYDESPPAPYFSTDGRGGDVMEELSVFRKSANNTAMLKMPKLDPANDPRTAWPYRGMDEAALDALAVVSMAGVCSEILALGNAEGGAADLFQLRQILASASSEEEGTNNERVMENRIRFALGYTMSQLRRHLGALDALAAAMERDASLAECVLAMETCENVSGQDVFGGDYELERRKEFQSEGRLAWVERVLLGGRKSIDTDEDRWVEGKGGGYRKETFRLTGDDPLYAALAVAFGFFVWASSGGLTLH